MALKIDGKFKGNMTASKNGMRNLAYVHGLK